MVAGESRIHMTLFARVLAAFILILVPICALGVMINVWGHNSVRKEQMESSRMNIRLYFSGLEYGFRYALGQQLKLVDDRDMMLLASGQGQYDDVAYYKAGIAVRKMLAEIKESDPFITEVKAYLPAKGMTLSTSTGFSQITGEYGQMKAFTQQGLYPFADYNGDILSCIASDVFLSESDDNVYLIAVRFSGARLLAALKQQEDSGSQRKAAFISTNHGITVMDEPDAGVKKALAGFAAAHKDDPEDSGTQTIRAGSRTLFVSWAKSGLLQTMLLFYTPEERFSAMLASYRYWLIALSALAVAGIFLFSVWIRQLIITPLNKLIGAYKSIETGNFDVELKYRKNDEFGFLYKRSNEMIRRLGALIEDVYEQKLHAREAELKQLQYQIHPHFLYNSILIIGNLIKMTDYDCAGKLARHLGSYYQYLTKSGDFVPLCKEAEHALNYIEIQAIRFTDRFSFLFDPIPAGLADFIVPRLILQPIIENAFKYGLAKTVNGGMLHVGLACRDGMIVISTEDNGKDLTDGKLLELGRMLEDGAQWADATGLVNVHRRIQIQYGRGSGLAFSRSALGGLRVEIRIFMKEGNGCVQSADC